MNCIVCHVANVVHVPQVFLKIIHHTVFKRLFQRHHQTSGIQSRVPSSRWHFRRQPLRRPGFRHKNRMARDRRVALQSGGQGGRGNVVPGTKIGTPNRIVVDRRVNVFKYAFKYSTDQNS